MTDAPIIEMKPDDSNENPKMIGANTRMVFRFYIAGKEIGTFATNNRTLLMIVANAIFEANGVASEAVTKYFETYFEGGE